MPGQPGWRRRRWEWSEAVIPSQNYVQPKPAVRNSLEGEVIVLSRLPSRMENGLIAGTPRFLL